MYMLVNIKGYLRNVSSRADATMNDLNDVMDKMLTK